MQTLYAELCCRTINARIARAIFPLILSLALTSCFWNTSAPIPTQTMTAPTPSPTLIPATEVAALPSDINPLTGRAMSRESLNRRPMLVKISNAPPLVRPQAGISAADIVYEHYTEGGLTRFSALFWSQTPTRVGSIHSARLIDDELTAMYGALLAYSGASDGVQAILDAADFAPRSYRAPTPYFFRDETSVAPHNLFLDVNALYTLAAQQGYAQKPDVRGMTFTGSPPLNPSGTGMVVEVEYAATLASWVYDVSRGIYLRFSDGEPHLDANNGAQVAAENVVILYARHAETEIVESVWQDVISYSIEIDLIGEGDAVVVRDGQRYDARWQRTERDQPLMLVGSDGFPLALKPGITWFQVFPIAEQQRPAEERVSVR